MHFLPILVFFSIIKVSLICAFGGPGRFFSFIKDCFSVGEDYWTWTTRTGELFEDAEIEAIEGGELVLKHRYGVVRLAIDALSEGSRELLYHTDMWADYLAGHPTEGKITPFIENPTAQAA